MGIILNDNITISAGKPIDSKYLNSSNTPYSATTEVNSAITISERYSGLTVNILGVEYWYASGVTDSDLIEKIYETAIPSGDFVTGATNLGYFSGYTGIMTLPINHLTDNDFDGNYNSLYNYYYRGTDGIIHIGTPSDGIPKRGFFKSNSPQKSWIWNEGTDGDNLVGWNLIDGDISTMIGTELDVSYPPYYDGVTKFPYSATTFTSGSTYNNGSDLVINSVYGSFTTGDTLIVGGRPYQSTSDNVMNLRTIISDNETISVYDDKAFIHISGNTGVYDVVNAGSTGYGIYGGKSGTTYYFKKLIPSGDTTIVDSGDTLIITSTGGIITTYDLSSPTTRSLGGFAVGDALTDMTSFEIFEELLAPITYPTLVVPSVCSTLNIQPSHSLYEIGTIIGYGYLTTNYCGGTINPQYDASCDARSCGVIGYCYTGPNLSQFVPSTSTIDTLTLNGYVVTSGAQSWDVCAQYCAGVQPYDSRGNVYDTPLTTGFTSVYTSTMTGALPWYWGLSESCVVDGICVASYGFDGCGGKCVQHVLSGCSISVTYDSPSDKYIWFAVPSCACTKTCWCVDGGNGGCIGGTGNLFGSPSTQTVSSLEGCWNGCNYNIYVSCYPTGTITGNPMYII